MFMKIFIGIETDALMQVLYFNKSKTDVHSNEWCFAVSNVIVKINVNFISFRTAGVGSLAGPRQSEIQLDTFNS